MSLVISLTCALVALLLQQWARRYLRVAHPRYSPHKRARIRAFYMQGVEELRIPLTIEVIPVLLHISLFLFLAGLSVYLFVVQRTIFKVVTAWIGGFFGVYAYLTVLPIIHKNNPCSSPLSSSLSFCLTGIRYLFFRLHQRFPHFYPSIHLLLRSLDPRAVRLDDYFSHSMKKTAEELAFRLGPSIDHNSLLWMFQSLNAHPDLEKFFEGLPRLCDSETGKALNLQQGFVLPNKNTLSNALIELMDRTLSSDLVPEFVKQRRVIICTKAIESTSLLGSWWILRRVLLGGWYQFLGCIEFGSLVQNWKDITHPVTLFYRQCVAALTISNVRDHDERWYQLASGLLGVSKTLLQEYIGHGDSVRLANTIFIVRRTVQTYSGSAERHRNDIIGASSKTSETVCKLDIRNTLPRLQHEFCGLWNQLVATAQSDPHPHHGLVARTILKNIRKLYITFHECSDTSPTAFYTTTDDQDPILDNPRTYPMCTNDDHLPSEPIPELQFDEPTPDVGDAPMLFPTPSPFPLPQLTRSHTQNVQPGANVRSPSPPCINSSVIPVINTFLDAAHTTQSSGDISQILLDILNRRWPELLQSVEMGHTLRRWSSRNDERFHPDVRRVVAHIVVGAQERDDCWISLVKAEFDIADRVLGDHNGLGDSVLLSILIHMTRQAFHTRSWTPRVLLLLSDFNIRDTFPELQHVFCALWNEIVLKAGNQRADNTYVNILREIQYAYIDLHRSTEAVLTPFSNRLDPVLGRSQLFRLCEVASHCQNITIRTPFTSLLVVSLTQLDQSLASSLPHHPPIEYDYTPGGSTAPKQAEETKVVVNPPSSKDYYTPHTGRITDAMQDTTPSATLNHPLETNQCTASVPSVSTGFSVPVFPLLRVTPLSNADPSQSGKTTLYPTGNMTMPRPLARGLVNRGNMCFANAILQLLVHCSSFWELGELMGKYGPGKSQKSDACMTPLVDATLRFLGEFVYKENSQSQMPQPQQQTTKDNPSDGEGKKEHNVVDSFEPTYMYDVMKGKAQLKKLLVTLCHVLLSPIYADLIGLYRMASSRMLRSFSAPTSKRSTKNCLILLALTSHQKLKNTRCLSQIRFRLT